MALTKVKSPTIDIDALYTDGVAKENDIDDLRGRLFSFELSAGDIFDDLTYELRSFELSAGDRFTSLDTTNYAASGSTSGSYISPDNLRYVLEHLPYAPTPTWNNRIDLGTSTKRFRTVYTNDLSLKNAFGDYTIVEGEEDLFLYNNKTGKVFKFLLQEVNPEVAPPKAV
jgi:hypothetical protein